MTLLNVQKKRLPRTEDQAAPPRTEPTSLGRARVGWALKQFRAVLFRALSVWVA